MPEAITITQDESPALSPENQEMLAAMAGEDEGKEGELLAGKYKSVQDLEQAYKELQTKLSRGESVVPEAEDDSTADDQADGNDKEDDDKPADNAREIYGDFIGGKFEEAGIDSGPMAGAVMVVIMSTVLLYGLTAVPVAKMLQIARPPNRAVAIVGGSG